jgi:hypothetical protein
MLAFVKKMNFNVTVWVSAGLKLGKNDVYLIKRD